MFIEVKLQCYSTIISTNMFSWTTDGLSFVSSQLALQLFAKIMSLMNPNIIYWQTQNSCVPQVMIFADTERCFSLQVWVCVLTIKVHEWYKNDMSCITSLPGSVSIMNIQSLLPRLNYLPGTILSIQNNSYLLVMEKWHCSFCYFVHLLTLSNVKQKRADLGVLVQVFDEQS